MSDTDEVKKIYWNIGEVAIMFGVASSAIRFWLKEFDIEVQKSQSGVRKFTAKDVEKIRVVHHLLKVDFYTLPGARKKLRNG